MCVAFNLSFLGKKTIQTEKGRKFWSGPAIKKYLLDLLFAIHVCPEEPIPFSVTNIRFIVLCV